jgi:RNA polymerase sigma factor (TIGR02999 family)
MTNVTAILSEIAEGNRHASEQLLPLVYDELRKLAAQKMAHEMSSHTLQATALVHEAYVRLVDVKATQDWKSRGHFFAAAAEAMRRILIDEARRRRSLRRGGQSQRRRLTDADEVAIPVDEELLDLDAALSKLADFDPQCAELVKLRFFAGLTIDEAAAALGTSPRTAKRSWTYARAWLRRELEADSRS